MLLFLDYERECLSNRNQLFKANHSKSLIKFMYAISTQKDVYKILSFIYMNLKDSPSCCESHIFFHFIASTFCESLPFVHIYIWFESLIIQNRGAFCVLFQSSALKCAGNKLVMCFKGILVLMCPQISIHVLILCHAHHPLLTLNIIRFVLN